MKFLQHPLWLVGFRPLFSLAILSGLLLPPIWVLIFTGILPAPAATFSPVQWHAHEMFFGFGMAILGGFLLTASKNWVHIRGFHGASLALLTGGWFLDRVAMASAGHWPPALFMISNNLFLVALVAMVVSTLIRHRAQDSFNDNIYFICILPLFILSKNLLLSADFFKLGIGMTLGLFRVAFLVMLERTLTQFMRGAFQVNILRQRGLDLSIKSLAFLLVLEGLLPDGLGPQLISPWLMLVLALLLTYRFAFWHPLKAFKRLDIGIMYLGYLAIIGQLTIEALSRWFPLHLVGAVSVHFFTLGVMGLIIPAMIIRLSKGHTGRPPVFDRLDKLVLWVMIMAPLFRVVAPQIAPSSYVPWLIATALCWLAGFSVLAWRYLPFLFKARVDGREH